MNDALSVCRGESIGNFNGQIERFRQRQRFAGNAALERLAVKTLHSDESLRFAGCLTFNGQLPNVIDGEDVWMIQRGCGLRLTAKTLERGSVFRHFEKEKFQGYGTIEPRVQSLVNRGHAAVSSPLHILEVRSDLVYQFIACRI